MAGATFVVYRKDNFGRDKHISAINSFSAKLRHARRRERLSRPLSESENSTNKTKFHNEADERRAHMLPGALALCKQAGFGMIDPFSSTNILFDHNVFRVVSFDLQSLVGAPSPVGHPAFGEDRMREGVLMYALRANTRHHLVVHLLGGKVIPSEEKEASMRALDCPATGYAYLSSRVTVMAEISKDRNMHFTALQFKHQAIRELRNDLKSTRLEDNFEEKIKTIHSLFTAEVACRNFEAAHAHSLALKHLLESDMSAILVGSNLSVLQGVLWQEVHRALLSMTEVNFDLDRWAEMLGLTTSFSDWESCSDGSPPADDNVADTFLHENLYSIMQDLMVLVHTPAAAFFGQSQSTLLRLSAQGLLLQSRLINRYLVDVALLSEVPQQTVEMREKVRAEAYMCLAILYWLRRAMINEKSICRPSSDKFYSASSMIQERLQALLTDSEPDFDPESAKAKSQLFASHVGAIAEQAEMVQGRRLDMASLPFHNKNFVLQACLMGLNTWSQVEEVLRGFLYHDGIGTAAQFWFEQVQHLLDRV